MNRAYLLLVLFAVLVLAGCTGQSDSVDSQSVQTIQNSGSDTIVNLALAWGEEYQTFHPEVSISVTGGGSGVGIASLINKTNDIANASRAIKDEEIAEAEKVGFVPYEIKVARDAIGVIVNPENPIEHLTLDQIARIYRGEISNWSELGGEDRPIVRLSRETNSGTHVYFLETVIRLGNSESEDIFSADTLLLPSSEGIIAEVRDNPNAIGYDGLGYITEEVKLLAIAKEEGSAYVIPSIATVNDGTYAIARDLFMYTRGEPEDSIKEYIAWITESDEAQAIVRELGFVPLSSN